MIRSSPDDVEQDHSKSRELVESSKIYDANVTRSSPVAHDDVHEKPVELLPVHTNNTVEHDDVTPYFPSMILNKNNIYNNKGVKHLNFIHHRS